MRFICESCRANLTIADEKLRGKRLIVRCKRCGVQIRLADPALATRAQSPRDDAAPRTAAPRTTAPPAPPLQAFASAPALWFALVRKDRVGPLTDREIESRIAAGEIHSATYVWKHGMDAWVQAQTIAQLSALFPAPPPPPADDSAPPAPGENAAAPTAAPGRAKADLPFSSAPQATPPSGAEALDLARWGAAELAKTSSETPVSRAADGKAVPSVSKPEFRIGHPQRRGPVRAALLVLGIAGVLSLAAFAILYERRDAAQTAQDAAEPGWLPSSTVDGSHKPPEQVAPPVASAEVAGHGTVPGPHILKKKVDESMPALQGCVDEALQRDPALRIGKILILTTVAPSGEVTSTRIDKKNIDQSQLGSCLKSAARNIHFPSFSGEAFPLDIPVVVARGK